VLEEIVQLAKISAEHCRNATPVSRLSEEAAFTYLDVFCLHVIPEDIRTTYDDVRSWLKQFGKIDSFCTVMDKVEGWLITQIMERLSRNEGLVGYRILWLTVLQLSTSGHERDWMDRVLGRWRADAIVRELDESFLPPAVVEIVRLVQSFEVMAIIRLNISQTVSLEDSVRMEHIADLFI
jgi:hypothetical protein